MTPRMPEPVRIAIADHTQNSAMMRLNALLRKEGVPISIRNEHLEERIPAVPPHVMDTFVFVTKIPGSEMPRYLALRLRLQLSGISLDRAGKDREGWRERKGVLLRKARIREKEGTP